MPLIEVSNDNLNRLDAIRNAKGLSLEDALREALDAAQFNALDEASKAAILNAPILTENDLLEGTDPTAPAFETQGKA